MPSERGASHHGAHRAPECMRECLGPNIHAVMMGSREEWWESNGDLHHLPAPRPQIAIPWYPTPVIPRVFRTG